MEVRPASPRGLDLLTLQLFVSGAETPHRLWLEPTPASFFATACALTGVVCAIGAAGPPDGGGVAGVRAVLVQLRPPSLVLLADLRQVVHAEAAQLLRDGSLTLSHTQTHTHTERFI